MSFLKLKNIKCKKCGAIESMLFYKLAAASDHDSAFCGLREEKIDQQLDRHTPVNIS